MIRLSGNMVSIKMLVLNADFESIKGYLDAIVYEHFQISKPWKS